jgi:hypothetical protein
MLEYLYLGALSSLIKNLPERGLNLQGLDGLCVFERFFNLLGNYLCGRVQHYYRRDIRHIYECTLFEGMSGRDVVLTIGGLIAYVTMPVDIVALSIDNHRHRVHFNNVSIYMTFKKDCIRYRETNQQSPALYLRQCRDRKFKHMPCIVPKYIEYTIFKEGCGHDVSDNIYGDILTILTINGKLFVVRARQVPNWYVCDCTHS